MSYFSNHSASRFLTNSSQTANTTANIQTSGSGGERTPPSATPAAGQQNPRRVPSKHFSTIVNPAQTAASKDTTNSSPLSSVGTINVHPLRHTYVRSYFMLKIVFPLTFVFCCENFLFYFSWVFWFRQQRAPGNKIANYEEGIRKITAFSSVCTSFFSLTDEIFFIEYRWNLSGLYGLISLLRLRCNPQPITCSFIQVSADLYGKTH